MAAIQSQLAQSGYAVIPAVYDDAEVEAMRNELDVAASSQGRAGGEGELYAIRRVLEVVPGLRERVFTEGLCPLLRGVGPSGGFLCKSIYFDKPQGSNWFVAWHQDLSISVMERRDVEGYAQWTKKSGVIGVVPPLRILAHTLTVRIHLDSTDASNGALRVVDGSHRWGIIRKERHGWDAGEEVVCEVAAGGVMLMRPLTLHASRRSQAGGRRRVLHLEFCNQELDGGMLWAERAEYGC